jgi:hypothetical protein
MCSYNKDKLELYTKGVKGCITPEKPNLFRIQKEKDIILMERTKIHLVAAKLQYPGKCGRPNILLAIQTLCRGVK